MKLFRKYYSLAIVCFVVMCTTAHANNLIYEYRNGNYDKFTEFFNKGQTSSDPVVLYYQGLTYIYGYGVGRDLKKGLNIVQKSAELGYLPAQSLVAKYYLLKQNEPEKAFKWFQKAANQDDLEAQMFVSAAYLFGYGVKRHHDKARKYYIAAAKNDNAVAQYKLATHFFESKHAKNHKLGVLWLQKSAGQGNPKAQALLGKLYLEGKMVEKKRGFR